MPGKKNQVDHKNGDGLDYTVNNLRWVTSSQNSIGTKRKIQMTFLEQARMKKLKIK